MGNKNSLKMRYLGVMLDCKLDWYPHTKHSTGKTSCCLSAITLSAAQKPYVRYVIPQYDEDLQICHTPSHHIRLRSLEYLDVQKSQKQTAENSEILPHFYNKGLQNSFTRGSISNCRVNAHRTNYAPI